jgi:hypothetical protein
MRESSDPTEEKWRALARQASEEQDSEKLVALVQQVIEAYDAEKRKSPPSATSQSTGEWESTLGRDTEARKEPDGRSNRSRLES